MIISKIILDSFGKFNGKSLDLENGINLVYGKNESGKSTIHKFVEAVFFGLNEENIKQKITNEEYKKFKPWGNSDVYQGGIIYEVDNEKYRLYRDFLLEDASVSVKDELTGQDITNEFEYDENKKERKPLSKIWKLNRLSFLNILGITDISNKSGKALIKEIQDQIVNVKNTNSSIISIEETFDRIEAAILDLKNDDEIIDLQRAIEQIQIEKEENKKLQVVVKEDAKRLFRYKKEIFAFKDQEADIIQQLKGRQQAVLGDKHKKVIEISEQIEQITKEIGDLDIYSNIKASEVEKYIENNKGIEIIQEIVNRKMDELSSLKAELYGINVGFSQAIMQQIVNDEFTSSFIADFEKLIATKKEKGEIEVNISASETLLDGQGLDSLEPTSYLKNNHKLEEDYHKYRDIKNWKEYIESNQDKTEAEELDALLVKTSKKKHLYQDLLYGCSLLIVASVIAAVFLQDFWFIFAGIAGILFVADVSIMMYLLKERQEVSRITYLIKYIQNEDKKNQTILHNNEVKIFKIIERYNCKTDAEFEKFYHESKSEDINSQILTKELRMLKAKNESMTFSITVQEGKINRLIESKGLSSFLHVEQGIEAIGILKELIKKSTRFLRMEDKISSIEKEIRSNLKEIERMKDEINESDIYIPRENFNLEDIQNKIALASQLEEKLKNMKLTKESLLGGMSEKELRDQFISPRNGEFSVISSDDEEYNDLANSYYLVKDRRSALSEQMSELYNQIVLKQSRVRKLSELNREEVFYKNKIQGHQRKIEIHEQMQESIKSSMKQIVDSFAGELKAVVNQIIYRITDKYCNIIFDDEMNIFVEDNEYNQMISIEQLSAGTIEQIYFALRVSLISVINQKINIPLFLDDCFLEYDVERLERVLKEVSKLDRQVVLLTCHQREQAIFDQLGVNYNYIEL